MNWISFISSAVWVVVTPQTAMTTPTPDAYSVTPIGSVQSKEWRAQKPAAACPIYERGVLVGYSLACGEKK